MAFNLCHLQRFTDAWSIPLPGGRKASFEDGILRIQLEDVNNLPTVPPLGTKMDPKVESSIQVLDTGTSKGYGTFCVATLESRAFLGFYEGTLRSTIDDLENTEYIMSIEGGAKYLDGFERAQDRTTFSPVHLNHADKESPQCNCLRVLCDDVKNVAFFTSRQIEVGEELCFDYGNNYWIGREQEKI
uniref:SET domain-containing protein n=1 Tax=Entomoneis paludosa TaxID=265537 RepID=A0A7S2YKT9_9STRA